MNNRSAKEILSEKIKTHLPKIEEWYQAETRKTPAPFYCSVDLRDSGYKIAPVDCNLYPAGFNNICPDDLRAAPEIFRRRIESIYRAGDVPLPSKILILPETHTKNAFYAENLLTLCQLIRNAGFETQLGWLLPEPAELNAASGSILSALPIEITEDGTLSCGGQVPDLVLLNNDFSGGYPEILDRVKQPIVPSYRLGWHSRLKSEHFNHYNSLVQDFARITDLDPELIQIQSTAVDEVNFNDSVGLEKVAAVVEKTLSHLHEVHKRWGITNAPYAVIKNNSGTYGMGVMTVSSPEEVMKLNRRSKNKMSVGKSRSQITSVIVQEGIPTETEWEGRVSEPVIYLLGSDLIGGFLRTHSAKGKEENLNAPGMTFSKLCMSDLDLLLKGKPELVSVKKERKLELVYGSIARLSALATGRELCQRLKDTEQNACFPTHDKKGCVLCV